MAVLDADAGLAGVDGGGIAVIHVGRCSTLALALGVAGLTAVADVVAGAGGSCGNLVVRDGACAGVAGVSSTWISIV